MDYICAALNASDELYGNHLPVLETAYILRDALDDQIVSRSGKQDKCYVISASKDADYIWFSRNVNGKSQNVHTKQWKSAEENDVSPNELEQRVDKKQRVFHAGPEAAKIRERILDSNVKRDTQTMEEIVDMKLSKPDSEIIDLMVDGTLSPKMNYNLSGKHIRNRDGLKDARSFDNTASEILASAPEVERIISRLIGTGEVHPTRNSLREYVEVSELTGLVNGNKTHYFVIIHSGTGWHLVPQ